MSDLLRSRKGIDTLLTEVAYANYQAESLIPFVAPTVTVQSRSGRILTFGKEQFAITSTKRTPYANHRRSGKGRRFENELKGRTQTQNQQAKQRLNTNRPKAESMGPIDP